jgi:hypothetical protein
MSAPDTDEARRLLHALRGALGSFVIHLAIVDDQEMSQDARTHLDAMLVNVDRMVEALAAISASFGLAGGKSTPLAILNSPHTKQALVTVAD